MAVVFDLFYIHAVCAVVCIVDENSNVLIYPRSSLGQTLFHVQT